MQRAINVLAIVIVCGALVKYGIDNFKGKPPDSPVPAGTPPILTTPHPLEVAPQGREITAEDVRAEAEHMAQQFAPSPTPGVQIIRVEVPPEQTQREPEETETDRKRRTGTEEFEAHVAALSGKADEADIAWQRFLAGCREEVTKVTAAAGVARP